MLHSPSGTGSWLRAALVLGILLSLAACGGSGGYSGSATYGGGGGASVPAHYYPPPGPPDDPWGPYIQDAAARFQVPGQWVRAVMHQESGGEEQATSSVGAIGLMQVMPETYAGLRAHYGLGDDPYEPHDNILAGTAYIREMYDRFGSPGFLAAYNAGPERVDEYLAGTESLPNETVNYLAAITPNLGSAVAMSGPMSMFGAGSAVGSGAAPSVTAFASGCDVDAAYDPDHPCRALEQAAVVPVSTPVIAAPAAVPSVLAQAAPPTAAASGGCDPDAAYRPGQPDCQGTPPPPPPPMAPPVIASAGPYAPAGEPVAEPASGGGWAIQVGAFASAGLARAVADGARTEAAEQLRAAAPSFPTVVSLNGTVLYRARLVGLSAGEAEDACRRLNQRQLPCLVVQPGGSELAQQGF